MASRFDKRSGNNDILQKKFIERVLKDTSTDIIEAQDRAIARINKTTGIGTLRNLRRHTVSGNTLDITLDIRQRFIDMRRIRGKRQKSGLIHNKVIFPRVMGGMVAELANGLTEDVKKQLSGEFKIDL